MFPSWWTRGDEMPAFEGEEKEVNNDHYSFVRTESGWEATGSGGGTAGPEDDPMRPRALAPRKVHLGGDWQDGGVRGITGWVGSEARTIEVEDRYGVARRTVEATLGLVIICFDPRDDIRIRVLDVEDQPLLETTRGPSPW